MKSEVDSIGEAVESMDVDDGEKKKKKKKKKTVRKISNRSNFEINLFMRTRLLTLLREYKMINFL